MKRVLPHILATLGLLLAFAAAPARAATQTEIDDAIQDGLAWLATQQNSDGSLGSQYLFANTAAGVLAFENEGHFPGGGTAYSDEVEQGLEYLFNYCRVQNIGTQAHGNPDSNGNGQGRYFQANSMMYETGMVMQTIVASNTPDRVVGAEKTGVAVAGGGFHSLAIAPDGSLEGWGDNYYGQTNGPPGNDYEAVAAGYYHSLALKSDGSIVGWGYNSHGQASPPSGNDFVAVAANYYHSLALKADGSLVGWGYNGYGQSNVPSGNDYVAIAEGVQHSLALRADGSIVGWGYGPYGEANAPAGNDFIAISAGLKHSLALKADGSLHGWGLNDYGQNGVPAGNDYTAIADGWYHGLALKADGSLVGWGYNYYGQATVPAGNDFVAVAAGREHSLAVASNDTIAAWGNNQNGQTGAGGDCAGMTYYEVMEDVVDWVAWGQVDSGSGRGGWNYGPNYSYGDNSVAQWPVLGLIAAEQWGVNAPAFVKTELDYWIDYIQNDSSGGSGYSQPNQMVNASKTGGLLVEMYHAGDEATSTRAQHAIGFINTRWNNGRSYWYGNKGHPYAMFSVFKGLELMGVSNIPNAPANDETPAGDWWGDYANYLVNTQTASGYWTGYYYWNQYLATPWYIIILQASVFPVSVDVVVPDSACDETGYDIVVHYSVERFEASGTLKVYKDDVLYDTVTLVDFQGAATVVYTIASDDVGANDWRAELDVTGGGISVHTEDGDTGTIYDTPDVSDIPDQTVPFTTFDLDDYQLCDCADTEWEAQGVPTGWTVTIDTDHIVTVTAPEDATEPAVITFLATFHWPGIDCYGSDSATFTVNQPPVAMAGPGQGYPDERYYVDEGGSVVLDGSQSYDPDGDEITFTWDMDGDEVYEASGAYPEFSAAGYDSPETERVYVYLKVCDVHDACDVNRARVDILNVPPIATFSDDGPVDEGSSFTLAMTDPSDPSTADTTAGFEYAFDCGDGAGYGAFGSASSAVCATDDNAIRAVKAKIRDKDGGVTEYTGMVDGGAYYFESFTGNDPLGQYRHWTFNLGEIGATMQPGAVVDEVYGLTDNTLYRTRTWNVTNTVIEGDGATFTMECVADDFLDNAYDGLTVGRIRNVKVVDGGTPSSAGDVLYFAWHPDSADLPEDCQSPPETPNWDELGSCGFKKGPAALTGDVLVHGDVVVRNVAPTIVDLTGTVNPVNINDQSPVSVEVAFTDPGTADTHDVTWSWGDGSTDDTQTNVTSPIALGHTYEDTGVYPVSVTVADDDGGTDEAVYEYIVIYDPDGGFVTGGGWIMSPAGAYAADEDLTGKANFGFVSKYKKGSNEPTGNTEFQFKAGDLNFHSSSYDWLVIAGPHAKFKGLGTINGDGNYGFMLTATDSDVNGGGDVDGFRIKIWDKENGDGVVYDNKMGEGDDSNDTTDIGGGSIKVHKK